MRTHFENEPPAALRLLLLLGLVAIMALASRSQPLTAQGSAPRRVPEMKASPPPPALAEASPLFCGTPTVVARQRRAGFAPLSLVSLARMADVELGLPDGSPLWYNQLPRVLYADNHISEYAAFHTNVRNGISGLGDLAVFDNSSAYGSAGVLRSVELYRDGAFTRLDRSHHEIGHQWIDYWGWSHAASVWSWEPSGSCDVPGGERFSRFCCTDAGRYGCCLPAGTGISLNDSSAKTHLGEGHLADRGGAVGAVGADCNQTATAPASSIVIDASTGCVEEDT